jgi:MarR family transcriptional regulator, organic hydroperoxide resistance regulator
MWLVTLAWQRSIKAVLRPHGLTHVQFVLLAGTWWLSSSDGAPTQRALAEWTGTDPMMTSQVLRRLEDKQLVSRIEDEVDTRAKRVRLTGDGQGLLLRVMPAVDGADAAFFAPVSQPQLLRALRRLADRPDEP